MPISKLVCILILEIHPFTRGNIRFKLQCRHNTLVLYQMVVVIHPVIQNRKSTVKVQVQYMAHNLNF